MSTDHRKSVGVRLAQAARAYRSRIGARLAELGLHAGQENVLKALSVDDGLSMSQLAATLAVQPPTVTKMVTRLTTQGYVERRASQGDARQALVFLTRNGRSVLAAVDKALAAVEAQALGDMDDKDRRRIRRLLRRIEQNLGGGDLPPEEV
jgi:DNA-binding MarR family transcriptional regulator